MANRISTYTSVSVGSDSRDGATTTATGTAAGAASADRKKDLWNTMLESVASGKKLPERNLLVFGGSVDSQREFMESLVRGSNQVPVANQFALGYTYYDVEDQEDTLARINLYLLSKPSPAFASLLAPLLTPATIPNTLIVVLLDWSEPWQWLRQLREWILLLRTVLISLSPECKQVMEEGMMHWRERGRGGPVNLDGTTAAVDGDALPPGPGEWEDALGLPLCVVCQNSEKTDILEKTQGWKDDEFDLVLQYLRTVLVKHGASLIYTTPHTPSQLPTLVHACLGVTSLTQRQPLKPEVIKRNEVVVPSNWDSWTKILVVREGFDVEKVSAGWSADLRGDLGDDDSNDKDNDSDVIHEANDEVAYETEEKEPAADNSNNNGGSSAVSLFENAIRDPGMDALALAGQEAAGRATAHLEVETDNLQIFLGQQSEILESLRQKDEERREKEAKKEASIGVRRRMPGHDTGGGNNSIPSTLDHGDPSEVMSSHIGPVQFNMGGIQVDADDMLERIKNRHEYGSSPEPMSPEMHAKTVPDDVTAGGAGAGPGGGSGNGAPENVDTDKMSAFFAGLMNRQTPSKS